MVDTISYFVFRLLLFFLSLVFVCSLLGFLGGIFFCPDKNKHNIPKSKIMLLFFCSEENGTFSLYSSARTFFCCRGFLFVCLFCI